jgi:hypothetical protein
MHGDIRKCVQFKFECSKTWETLSTTGRDDIRHCSECERDVHYCFTDADMLGHAEAGHCVARRIPLTPERFVNVLGEPESGASREELVTLWRGRLEEIKTYALQRVAEAERCGNCGFPVCSDGMNCSVCRTTEFLSRIETGEISGGMMSSMRWFGEESRWQSPNGTLGHR